MSHLEDNSGDEGNRYVPRINKNNNSLKDIKLCESCGSFPPHESRAECFWNNAFKNAIREEKKLANACVSSPEDEVASTSAASSASLKYSNFEDNFEKMKGKGRYHNLNGIQKKPKPSATNPKSSSFYREYLKSLHADLSPVVADFDNAGFNNVEISIPLNSTNVDDMINVGEDLNNNYNIMEVPLNNNVEQVFLNYHNVEDQNGKTHILKRLNEDMDPRKPVESEHLKGDSAVSKIKTHAMCSMEEDDKKQTLSYAVDYLTYLMQSSKLKSKEKLPVISLKRPLDSEGREIKTPVTIINHFRLKLPVPGRIYKSTQEMLAAGVKFELVYENKELSMFFGNQKSEQ